MEESSEIFLWMGQGRRKQQVSPAMAAGIQPFAAGELSMPKGQTLGWMRLQFTAGQLFGQV